MNLAIVQARVGSSRLPGKVLADVCGKPLLWYVVERVKLAKHVDQVVVAVPDTAEDLAIQSLCATWNIPCVSGPEHDVLARFKLIADLWQPAPDRIVRITADCPLIDPDVIDATIEQLRNGDTWASNIVPRTWPDGLDVEVVTRLGLHCLDQLTTDASDREHVTPALYHPKQLFGIGGELRCPVALGDLRWTVDTQADLDWVRQVYARVPWDAGWSRILFSGIEHRRAA
jgi:spore coat polysaccharide biosynthesis protein SpsF